MKTKLFLATILISLTGYVYASSDSVEFANDSRSLKDFSSIIINSTANVIVSQEEGTAIRIEGDKKDVQATTTEVANGTLSIYGTNSNPVTIYISTKELNLIEVNSNARVYARGVINSDVLLLKVNGNGTIKMDVRALTLGLMIKGEGRIIVSGSTGDSFSKIIGKGTIYSSNLDSRSVGSIKSNPLIDCKLCSTIVPKSFNK